MEELVRMPGVWEYYRGRRVFVTGHTGFKGAWLMKILSLMGAQVTGYALGAPTTPALFELADTAVDGRSVLGDVRDRAALESAFRRARPEVVFHLAAQPIVREGYRAPVDTFETNVLGTVYLLECCRECEGVRSVVNVTTDKVYENREWVWGYRETEPLDSFDPYSNSKSCSDMLTHCYRRSFLEERGVAVSTARAGNVIGGGDFAKDRIVPDCVRAAREGRPALLRNPVSIRPYQHVLEALFAYLLIAMEQAKDPRLAGAYNVGPDECDCVSTRRLAELFCGAWGEGASFAAQPESGAPHEAAFLKLDCSRLKAVMGWRPTWDVGEAVRRTCEWSKAWLSGEPVDAVMRRQIRAFAEDAKW